MKPNKTSPISFNILYFAALWNCYLQLYRSWLECVCGASMHGKHILSTHSGKSFRIWSLLPNILSLVKNITSQSFSTFVTSSILYRFMSTMTSSHTSNESWMENRIFCGIHRYHDLRKAVELPATRANLFQWRTKACRIVITRLQRMCWHFITISIPIQTCLQGRGWWSVAVTIFTR